MMITCQRGRRLRSRPNDGENIGPAASGCSQLNSEHAATQSSNQGLLLMLC